MFLYGSALVDAVLNLKWRSQDNFLGNSGKSDRKMSGGVQYNLFHLNLDMYKLYVYTRTSRQMIKKG